LRSEIPAANADHAFPNILVFVNHADAASWADLESRFLSNSLIACVPEIVASFAGGYIAGEPANSLTQARNRALRRLAKRCLEFAERHLDGVQVRRVLREHCGGAKFPGFGLLLAGDGEGAPEMGFRFRASIHLPLLLHAHPLPDRAK
jgi:hypothetical protein